jgi:hypothetical protein
MKLSKPTLRLALLGSALVLCVLASGGRVTAATCNDGDTRFVFTGNCCLTPNGILAQKKGQSCINGVWTDNGARECSGPCPVTN